MKKWLTYGAVFLTAFFMLFSCDQTEIVSGNQAPPDGTVENAQVKDYVNRLYISLIGREPLGNEESDAISMLRDGDYSITSRQNLIQEIQSLNLFNERLYEITRQDLLNGVDTAEVGSLIGTLLFIYQQSNDSTERELLLIEINRLFELAAIPSGMKNGTIGLREMHKRCLNNTFFDQLNMGSENFVVAAFQHFLFRYPTAQELEQAVRMVDGFQDVLFFEIGESKDDFLEIFMNSRAYEEGVVRQLYLRHLLREPNPTESLQLSSTFSNSNDFKLVQRSILASDDYAQLD